jgi:hypothetical protein
MARGRQGTASLLQTPVTRRHLLDDPRSTLRLVQGGSEKKGVAKLGSCLSTGATLERNGSPSQLVRPRDFSRLLRRPTLKMNRHFRFSRLTT